MNGLGIVDDPRYCTMDAMLCADGSTVGRTGPNCELAPCPTSTSGAATRFWFRQPIVLAGLGVLALWLFTK